MADSRSDGPTNGWEPAPAFSRSNGPPAAPVLAPSASSGQPARHSLMAEDTQVADMLGRTGTGTSNSPGGARGPRDHRSSGAGFQRVLDVLRRRWRLLALCALLVPAAALILSLNQEESYSASSSLLFRDSTLDETLLGNEVGGRTDPARVAATNFELVSSEAIAVRAARRLASVPSARDPEALADKISVEAQGESDIVTITASDANPRVAARIANVYAEEVVASRQANARATIREAQRAVRRQLRALPPAQRATPRGEELRGQAQQLTTLAAVQFGDAEVAKQATVPDAPSAPRPLRNTAFGLVLGLLLGAAAVFGREQLDRRLKDADDVEDAFGLPVIAGIPESRAIASPNGTLADRLPRAEAEAFQMLRANLRYFNVDREIRSVLITSAAPREGKSTVSWNLAAAAAGTGANVLLIEADLRRPTLARSLGLEADEGLSLVLAGVAKPEDVTLEVFPGQPEGGDYLTSLKIIPAGPLPPNPAELLESARMQELLRQAEEQYDLVVVDTPPTSVVADAIPLVRQTTGVILVSRLHHTTRDAAEALSLQLRNLGAPILGVVVNGTEAAKSDYYK